MTNTGEWNTKDYPHCHVVDGKQYLSITETFPIYNVPEDRKPYEIGNYGKEKVIGPWEDFEFKFKSRKSGSPTVTAWRRKPGLDTGPVVC